MTLDEFKAMEEAARLRWHDRKAAEDRVLQVVFQLHDLLRDAGADTRTAHADYKHAKELRRIARDFGATSIKDAEMLLKLRS